MKALTLAVALIALLPLARAETGPKSGAGDEFIEAEVVAFNRSFGFYMIAKGTRQGITEDMEVAILRDKKWVTGILKIGELGESEVALEYEKGKSDPRDVIRKVRFHKPKAKAKDRIEL